MSEAKEVQVQEVVSGDQEDLMVNAGVVDQTLIEEAVLTPQRKNLESDSEHSGSSSEARSEVDLLGLDSKEDEKERRKP